MIKKLCASFSGARTEFVGYWRRYGGISFLVTSPFFWLAVVLTISCAPYWWGGNWWELSGSVIPSILGFSIAAFALLLSLGDDGFKLRFGQIREEGKESTLTNLATSFFHFIVVQVLALAAAFVGGARILSWGLALLPDGVLTGWTDMVLMMAAKGFRAVGFFLLAYSLMTAVAAAMTIYRLALIYSVHATTVMRSRGLPEDRGGRADPTPP